MAGEPRDTAKYRFLDSNGRVIRSGITRRPLDQRERELQREVNSRGRMQQVGRRTTDAAARVWEKRQPKGTPPGGR